MQIKVLVLSRNTGEVISSQLKAQQITEEEEKQTLDSLARWFADAYVRLRKEESR